MLETASSPSILDISSLVRNLFKSLPTTMSRLFYTLYCKREVWEKIQECGSTPFMQTISYVKEEQERIACYVDTMRTQEESLYQDIDDHSRAPSSVEWRSIKLMTILGGRDLQGSSFQAAFGNHPSLQTISTDCNTYAPIPWSEDHRDLSHDQEPRTGWLYYEPSLRTIAALSTPNLELSDFQTPSTDPPGSEMSSSGLSSSFFSSSDSSVLGQPDSQAVHPSLTCGPVTSTDSNLKDICFYCLRFVFEHTSRKREANRHSFNYLTEKYFNSGCVSCREIPASTYCCTKSKAKLCHWWHERSW